MKRFSWFLFLVIAANVIIVSAGSAAPRNVVLFVTDDQSPDTGCYGNRVIKTPNLDAIARDGTMFTHAFCTTASCSASRSVILTGLHNHANGQYGHQHSYHKFNSYANVSSLPVYLDKAGYRTARCGKYHVAPEAVYQFDEAIPGNSRSPVEMANNCESFIAADGEEPFFLYFCTSDPHRGGGTADELPFKPNRFGNPASGGKGYPGIDEVIYDPSEVLVPGFLPDTPTCRAEIAQYYQSVSRIDQGLGRLSEILRESGRWDDTLFIYISDHGIAMPGAKTTLYEGGMRAPCIVRDPTNNERGIVSDAMVSWVDIVPTVLDFARALDPKTGQVKSKLVKEIASPRRDSQKSRQTSAGDLHGRSFLPILGQTHSQGWDEVFASHTFHEIQMYYPMRVVRGRKYKLIWNIAYPLPFPFASDLWAAPTWQAQYNLGRDAPYGAKTVANYIHRPQFELFDIELDPHEGKNLSSDPEFTAVMEIMKAKLKDYQQQTNDPWIIKWKYE
ncbi:MAG: sulfatase [Pirellulaceae bacterium]|jgi:N-sulfoglucosamine sulfohydrolase|nr:sulfatase [Pirellulaceae bacterium]MDP6557988.1 sulfatase [Pirellulaceae bacterium]